MKAKLLLWGTCTLFSMTAVFAQQKEGNLLKNGDFEPAIQHLIIQT